MIVNLEKTDDGPVFLGMIDSGWFGMIMFPSYDKFCEFSRKCQQLAVRTPVPKVWEDGWSDA